MLDHIIVIGYALFLFLGGAMGAKAGSRISLIMGSVSGALVLVGDVWIRRDVAGGFLFLTVVAGLLTIVFLQRLLKTKKMMPSGMLLIVNVLFFGFCLSRLLS
jgi:uncharacterized membrane protein (UPF0136 family)